MSKGLALFPAVPQLPRSAPAISVMLKYFVSERLTGAERREFDRLWFSSRCGTVIPTCLAVPCLSLALELHVEFRALSPAYKI